MKINTFQKISTLLENLVLLAISVYWKHYFKKQAQITHDMAMDPALITLREIIFLSALFSMSDPNSSWTQTLGLLLSKRNWIRDFSKDTFGVTDWLFLKTRGRWLVDPFLGTLCSRRIGRRCHLLFSPAGPHFALWSQKMSLSVLCVLHFMFCDRVIRGVGWLFQFVDTWMTTGWLIYLRGASAI